MDVRQIAEAFSGHRFTETYDHLAESVCWILPGQGRIDGRAAVVRACDDSAAEMSDLTGVVFTRFVSVAGERVAAVDAIGRYRSPDGSVSVVSSADIYEFDDEGLLARVTSYGVELEA